MRCDKKNQVVNLICTRKNINFHKEFSMKLSVFFSTIGLILQSFCFADGVPLFNDSLDNQEYRIEVALSNVKAAHLTLARIQKLAHEDPNKACDLACTAVKYLMNAEECLYNPKVIQY